MKNRTKLVMLFCSIYLIQGVFGAEKPNNTDIKQVKKTIITGERFTFNPVKNFAIYEGDVVVIDPQMDLLCNKLTIYFDSKKKVSKEASPLKQNVKGGQITGKEDVSVKKDSKVAPMVGLGGNVGSIIAEGDVEIINKKDKTRAIGGHAHYTAKTEILTLTINPKLFTKQGVLLGRTIIYSRKTGELSATQAVLESDGVKAPQKKPNGK